MHIDALTKALAVAGHEVLICGPEGVSTPDTPVPLDAGKGGGGSRSRLPGPLYELAEYGYSLPAARRLKQAAETFEPDIVYERYNLYFHAGVPVARALGLPLLLEVNAPLVSERQATGQLALPPLGQWSERRLWRQADAVLPVTEVLAEMIAAEGVPRDKLHVIPNAVDDAALTPADGSAVRARYDLGERLVLGFIGFVRDWHGVDRVIDWLATPEGEGAHLLLVGDGPAAPDLRAHAERLGVSDRLTVTGVVQRDAVPAHIAAFDIALQPAVTAYASPLKLQEYMAQGCCVVAPDQPNIREVVTHGETAFLTPPGDVTALHGALSLLAEDTQLRQGLGTAARRVLLEREMTWPANARRVVEIAEGLLAKRKG